MTDSPLHVDLIEMLEATRTAEEDVFGALPAGRREAPGADGGWSAKDIWAHLAAWRSIEARRIEAAVRGEGGAVGDDPAPGDPIDESNERLQAAAARWSWEIVRREAGASVDALIAAIRRSSTELLHERDGIVVGIGSNGINHAIGHLTDIVAQGSGGERLDALVEATEAILRRDNLSPRDTGVILYNVACHRALSGRLDEARRLLREAFAHRGDLLESAIDDPDLAALAEDLQSLSGLSPDVSRS